MTPKSVDEKLEKKENFRGGSHINFDNEVIESLTKRNLEMTALRKKGVNRKMTKNKSKIF